jgi:hypothetical protein
MKREYDFSKGKRGPVLRPPADQTQVAIRLDNDVLDWLRTTVDRAGGGDYENLIKRGFEAECRTGSARTPAFFAAGMRRVIGGDGVHRAVHDALRSPRPRRSAVRSGGFIL